MQVRKIIFLSIFALFTENANSQVKLVDEKIFGNKYQLSFETVPVQHSFKKTSSSNQISFEEFVDESKPGSLSIPRNELFIAIPPNSNPAVKLIVTDKVQINASPVLNPEIRMTKEGRIIKNINRGWDRTIDPDLMNRGIIRIGNNSCLHISIALYNYEIKENYFYCIRKFIIEISFTSEINTKSISANSYNKVPDIIVNRKFASQNINPVERNIPEITGDWIDYRSEYIKMGIPIDGIYRINSDTLSKWGASVNSIDPKTFQLFWKGEEVPVYVYGEQDGRFDAGDYVEFVGIRNYGGRHREINDYNTPYNEYLDRYNDTTIVWLTWGKQNGIRATFHNIPAGTSSKTINYYNHLIHLEQNIWFDFSIDQLVRRQNPEWLENETWSWRTQGVGTINLGFQVSNIVQSKAARAIVKLQSYVTDISRNAHKIGLSINNESKVYDSLFFNSNQQKIINAYFNSELLFNGTNNIKCISYKTGATVNSVYHDWYEIEYPRSLILENDLLQFKFNDYKSTETANYEISGYSGGELSIYKFTDMLDVSRIDNFSRLPDKVIFTDNLDSTKKYFVAGESKVIPPKIYYKKKFFNLRNSSNSADYLIITNPLLMKAANEYAGFIAQNYNKKVGLINVFDVCDEFNYGFFAPEPIKNFLKTAYYNWSGSKPEYILLLGSACYDYYEYRQKQLAAPPHPNLVPSFGVPVSDNWYLLWNNESTYNSQMKIGRIPARTEEEVRNYLLKHQKYLEQPYTEINKRSLFFSGGLGNDQYELDQLRNANQYIIDNLLTPVPIGGRANHFYKTLNPNTNFGPFTVSQVQNAIDSSGIFISYLGHSGTQTWDNSITEVKQLQSRVNALPLITDFGCSTAKFAEPDVTSFGELFVASKDGEAICYIGNTSLGFISSSLNAPKLFYETVLKDSVLNISDALNKTKIKLLTRYGATEVNKLFLLTNSLIGDPIISLRIPGRSNLKISSNDIGFNAGNISSRNDSIVGTIRYLNLGRTHGERFSILVKDTYNNVVVFEEKINRTIPLYADSIIISFLMKDRPGKHLISVDLDCENNIVELYENDNKAEVELFLASSLVRDLTLFGVANSFNTLLLLNPITKSSSDLMEYQLGSNQKFDNSVTYMIPFGELFTKINFDSLPKEKRYWFRVRPLDQTNYERTKSFYHSKLKGYMMNDSVSFAAGEMTNVVAGETLRLGRDKIVFEAISAGFNDGNTALITKNNQNYIPFPNRGHNVCVFDGTTYELKVFKQFDLLMGGNTVQNAYAQLLDSLKSSDIFIVVVVDEGSIGLNSSLKQKLKSFGSRYVDSLGFRDSWAMIGRKGSIVGSVPEAYSQIFNGRAITNTFYEKNFKEGIFTTELIGPVSKWGYCEINYSKPEGTDIIYSLIGENYENKKDTLQLDMVISNIIDLTNIDSKMYPYLRLKVKLIASPEGNSPEVKSIFNSFAGLAELGTNYQVVYTERDTLEQGENINLAFSVYNVGESRAEKFKVKAELVKADNSHQEIYKVDVDSLGIEQKRLFNISYNTAENYGPINLKVIIDEENKIHELYKDNNYYSVPVYVKPNSKPASLKLTFDGEEISDGDFISTNPSIRIELTDQSIIPIKDTTAVQIFLNNRQIYFSNNSSLNYLFSNTNPKLVIDYTPSLENGTYTLKVMGKNATGDLIDSTGIIKKFSVQNELQLIELYNYPNPFNNETYFTFKLTQLPDELRIKIYTLAGRMIKEFVLMSSEMRYDFNTILWDGRDADGDLIANGVYLYKVVVKRGSEFYQKTQKLAVVR